MSNSRSSSRAFLQRKSGEAPSVVHEALRSPGRPLDPATRSLMESRFGQDFSQVRLRTGGPPGPQGKLTVGSPGDAFEQEADRMAELVSRRARASGEGAPRHDFSRVHIHTDPAAAESARAV